MMLNNMIKHRFILFLIILFCNFICIAYAGEWATTMIGNPTEYKAVSSSMGIDNYGKLHISYHDTRNSNLRYATNAEGVWKTVVLDDGRYPSLAIQSNGKVHISYYAQTTGNDLNYATNVSGSWVVKVVDSDGDVGKSSGIALDSLGNAHICYIDSTNNLVKYATNASGVWEIIVIDNGSSAGSIVIDSSDNIHVVYNDGSFLKYAIYTDNSWKTSALNVTGSSPSITVDSSNHLHMSYSINSTLNYATNVSGFWESENVTGSGSYVFSGSGSIALDSSDNPHICYYNYQDYSLKYATNQSGAWQITTIDPYEAIPDHIAGEYLRAGRWCRIAVDSDDSVHITYEGSIDATTLTLRYATNKIPLYNLSGEWNYSTKDNWSPWCDPGENSVGTFTLEQNGNDVKATVANITAAPITFQGKAAGSIYEVLATFPEDNGETTMIFSFMATSTSNATGPQIWIYREPPTYC